MNIHKAVAIKTRRVEEMHLVKVMRSSRRASGGL